MVAFDLGFVRRALGLGPHHRLSRAGSQDRRPQIVLPSFAVDPVAVPVPADDPVDILSDVSDAESSTADTVLVVPSSPPEWVEEESLALEDTSVFVLLGPG